MAISTLKAAILLHKTVIWNPNIHPGPDFLFAPIPIQDPNSDHVYDLDNWPFSPTTTAPPQPTPSSSGVHPGTQSTHVPAMTSDEVLDWMERGGFFIMFAWSHIL